MDDSQILIIGANGQLGTALQAQYPNAKAVDSDQLDITDRPAVDNFDWTGIRIILNAAAYTNVDGAESAEGRVAAWQVNAVGVKNLTYAAWQHQLEAFVHISTDYVFDGTHANHTEEEAFAPLSAYGASKAAGDLLVSQIDKHYILRTGWVVGEGKNFVRTMLSLASKGISPRVVSDQIGRLTFTSELVRAIDHLLTTKAPFGTYNVSNDGEPVSWAAITRQIFANAGRTDLTVTDQTTADYVKDKPEAAPRPLHSALDLSKLKATGFTPHDWKDDLKEYIKKEQR
jgi:dTDP-4-dehydrorhamnose 3,5-epimerase